MTDTRRDIKSRRTVGEKVQVRRDDGVVGGTIVEDFADSLIPRDRLGRDWAQPHRWAIALDSGVLVFVDDSDLDDSDTAAPR
ncbi:hypothetical protein CH254_24180 [Rhodococcus sp. 06-412-2C]|uniref:hypothetical protein n=1 Tax=unclassified Rhodococcus (in: high G+C Gram-positive bacteria) TaxID=192944 RepID=UPI000B9B5FED|nr:MULTISPECIES: hypothetical protein [unclassified Rhodococcus (in: high G+C Gram-positive bacteria)]OZC83983.1 hypothetical protein CH254_24180 [Rhodococcus sp. 06-412-2C]OZC94170.1 hypothetical protein CH279_22265 [Rhodococcus sp. 06-412-2B]